MKTIFILLLGFGGAYPMVCSKEQNKSKQESELIEKNHIQTYQKTYTYSTQQNNWKLINRYTIEIYS
jgi:hypothetical protein